MRRLLWSVAALGPLLTASNPAFSSVVAQGAGVVASGGNNLFSSVGTQTQVSGQDVWPASIDTALIATLPTTLLVNFPDRATATLTRMRGETRSAGSFLWTGRGDGCTAMLNVVPSNVFGVISCVTGNYSLKGPGQNLQLSRFVRTNTAAFEPPAAGAVLAPYVEPHAQPLSGAQVDTVIDVLVLYTDAVRLYLESVGGGPGASRQFAQSAVDMVQSAMDASTTPGDPVIANVRLVGARVVSRTSTGDLNADQRWLDNDPEPLALRDFYSADIVMYLTSSGQGTTFGTANVPGFNLPPPGPGFAPSAHASLVVRCAVQPLASDCPDPYIFAHELGHLFGANHNPEVPTSPTPVEPWAFAHWAHNNVDGGGAHTLVAYYVSSCAPAASQCPIVLKYSNAQVYDDWFRTGVTNQRENARVIAEFAPTTAQYRLDVGRIFYDGFQY